MSGQFEFNDKLLVFLAEELYNCKYGDFFFNCEQERIRNELRDKTFTIWFTIDLQREFFKNPAYVGIENAARVTQLPVVQIERLRYWKEYFSKYSETQTQTDEDYLPDAYQQLSLALEEEVDISILLSQALERSKQQVKVLLSQDQGDMEL